MERLPEQKPKCRRNSTNNKQWYHIEIKTFCTAKRTSNTVKRISTRWEEILSANPQPEDYYLEYIKYKNNSTKNRRPNQNIESEIKQSQKKKKKQMVNK